MDFVWLLLLICQRKFMQKIREFSLKKHDFGGTKIVDFLGGGKSPGMNVWITKKSVNWRLKYLSGGLCCRANRISKPNERRCRILEIFEVPPTDGVVLKMPQLFFLFDVCWNWGSMLDKSFHFVCFQNFNRGQIEKKVMAFWRQQRKCGRGKPQKIPQKRHHLLLECDVCGGVHFIPKTYSFKLNFFLIFLHFVGFCLLF